MLYTTPRAQKKWLSYVQKLHTWNNALFTKFRHLAFFLLLFFLTSNYKNLGEIGKREVRMVNRQNGTTSLQAKSSELAMESSGQQSRSCFKSICAFRFARSVQSL